MPQFDELLRQCPKNFDQGCRCAILNRLRDAARQVGLPYNSLKGHSFRIGVAFTAAAADLPDWLIKVFGQMVFRLLPTLYTHPSDHVIVRRTENGQCAISLPSFPCLGEYLLRTYQWRWRRLPQALIITQTFIFDSISARAGGVGSQCSQNKIFAYTVPLSCTMLAGGFISQFSGVLGRSKFVSFGPT